MKDYVTTKGRRRALLFTMALAVAWCALSLFAGYAYAVDKSGVGPNKISLPSGPGSIEGLGESFQPTLNTGTAKYRVRIVVPPGTAGHAPDLALNYDGGGSNGVVGFGWSIEVPFIQRQTDKGIPRYVDGDNEIDDDRDGETDEADEIDIFINEMKEELVQTESGFYFCETEGPFIRYQRAGDHWEGTLPNGTLMEFGLTEGARIADQGRVHCWLLERLTDTNGNTIVYSYLAFPGSENLNQKYLNKIEYGPGAPPWGNLHFVSFQYENRPDWFEDCRSGFVVRTGKRIGAIITGTQGPELSAHASDDFNDDGQTDYLNRRYVLAYEAHPHWSLLTSVTWIGADNQSEYPPLTFEYTVSNPPDTVSVGDEIIGSLNTPPHVMDNPLVDMVDLNGDALPDILKTEQYGGSHTAYLNKGEVDDNGAKAVSWGTATEVSSADGFAWNINLENGTNAVAHLADMDGDGLADLVYKSALDDVYYFENMAQIGWGPRLLMNIDPSGSSPPSPFAVTNVKTADLDFDKNMDVIQSIGVAGGADYRIWFNLGRQKYSRSVTVGQVSGFMLSDPGVHIADFNGDRIPDILRVRPTTIQVTAGLGYGNFASLVTVALPDYTLTSTQVDRARFQDVSGDGLVDLVIERAAPGQLWYWINQGNYSLSKRKMITGMPASFGAEPEIRWVDLNGNGTTDLVYADRFSSPRIQTVDIGRIIGCVPSPNMLLKIDNGIGRKTTIEYATSTRYLLEDLAKAHVWPNPLPFPVNVVSRVLFDDSMGNLYVTEYAYHDGYYDGEQKEFRGFAAVEVREVGDAIAPDLITAYEFHTGVGIRALKGKAQKLTAKNAQDEVFYREQYTWTAIKLFQSADPDGTEVTFPYQESKIRDVIERGNGTPIQIKWEYEYDEYGNMTRSVEHGRMDEGWNDERVTVISYTSGYSDGRNAWILRNVVEQEITDETGVRAALSRSYYDGNDLLGALSRGNLTATEEWVYGDEYIKSVRNDYDSFGNIIAMYDPLYGIEAGHYREVFYDDAFHTFPVKEVIHIGNPAFSSLIFEGTYDSGIGTLASSMDFNGFTTTYGYDAFGRITSITKPPGGGHTVEYDYVLAWDLGEGTQVNWVETRQRDGSPGDGFLRVRKFFDGMGRSLMIRSECENQEQVVVSEAVEYNARGAAWREYLPYYDSGDFGYAPPTASGPFVENMYDALGRQIRMNQPEMDGRVVYGTTDFVPLGRTVRDEAQNDEASGHFGAATRYVEDGLLEDSGSGRLREVVEVVKIGDEGEILSQPAEWRTSYAYDLLGRLTKTTDAQGNSRTFTYDGLGRRVHLGDPDRGAMSYNYDAAGNLVRVVDNKMQATEFTYDGANRLLTIDYLDVNNRTPDVKYHYDVASPRHGQGANTKGRLSWVEDLSGAEFFAYDGRGNLSWNARRIQDRGASLEFVTTHAYDEMDRLVATIYPDGERLEYDFNARSLLASIHGFVDSMGYDASGDVTYVTHSNGVRTDYTYDPRDRLISLVTQSPGAQEPLQNLRYSFDDANNVSAITDERSVSSNDPSNATQSLLYDDLYRLIAATGSGYGRINYKYDRIGNLIRQASPEAPDPLHVTDPLVNLGAVTYGGTAGTANRGQRSPGGPPGPHAVTATASGLAFAYDDNGNVTGRAQAAYSRDFQDRLVRVEKDASTAHYVYDHSGQRVIKRVEEGTVERVTYYVNGEFELRDGRPVKHVFAGRRRVAQVEGPPAPVGQAGWQVLALQQGWNAISFEVEPADPSVAAVLDALQGTEWEIWGYDTAGQRYLGYAPGRLQELTELHASRGYMLHLDRPFSLQVFGTRMAFGTVLEPGWNLVGCLSAPTEIREALSSLQGSYEAVWGHQAGTGTWSKYLPTQPAFLSDLETLHPAKAYWVKMTAGAQLVFGSGQRKHFYHPDHLGSSSLVTDEAGAVAERTEFYPYGRPRFEFRTGFEANYRFTGKESDRESGLIYFGARHYDPVVGRFMSVDPLYIDDPAGALDRPGHLNLYAYCRNNPIVYLDPLGLVETVGELIERKGVESAEQGSFLKTAGWAVAGAVWSVFGAESLSKVEANRISGRNDLTTSDKVGAAIEVAAAVAGPIAKGISKGKQAYQAAKALRAGSRAKELVKAGKLPNLFRPLNRAPARVVSGTSSWAPGSRSASGTSQWWTGEMVDKHWERLVKAGVEGAEEVVKQNRAADLYNYLKARGIHQIENFQGIVNEISAKHRVLAHQYGEAIEGMLQEIPKVSW